MPGSPISRSRGTDVPVRIFYSLFFQLEGLGSAIETAQGARRQPDL